VELLVEGGADVNAVGDSCHQTALTTAANSGNIETVEYLLQLNANVNLEPNWWRKTPLRAAAEGEHLDIVDRLLQAGAEINSDKALHTPTFRRWRND
jgi:ankyrin repeat protein